MCTYIPRIQRTAFQKSAKMGTFGDEAGSSMLNLGSNMVMSGFNSLMQKDLMRDAAELNYKYGEMAADSADKRTRALFTDLYSPEAKTQQLEKAGLNKSLMYGMAGAGGQGATGAMGQGAGGQHGNLPSGSVMGIDLAQQRLARAQAANLEEDTRTKRIDNDAREPEAAKQEKNKTTTQEVNIKNIVQDTKNKEVQEEGQQLLNDFQRIENGIRQLDSIVAHATLAERVEATIDNYTMAKLQCKQTIQKMEIDKRTSDEQIKLWKDTRGLLQQQALSEMETIISKQLQNKITEKSMDDLVKQIHYAMVKTSWEAKNEKEFRERFEAEIKQRNKEAWIKAGTELTTQILDIAASAFMPIRMPAKAASSVAGADGRPRKL